ncbi:PEN family class A beta-lactamase, Bpc-type [Actinomadura vinacea]|uniref:Beta-lactamase n=1 Tax=Actinomadura vinacea TaxID=115336 RepID=A0ABP5VTB7_9ACTN
MKHTSTPGARPRPPARTGLALLAAAALIGGAACGAGPASAVPAAKVAASKGAAPASTPQSTSPAPALQKEVRERLRRLETSYDGRIGMFALDTGTGSTIGYRSHESFPLASTFKAIASAAILDRARRLEPGLLERRVFWTAEEEVLPSPVTEGRGGTGMTMAELCAASISHSDNTAANLMLKELGGPAGLTRYFRSLGDPVSRLDRTEPDLNIWRPGERRDTTTPAAAGRDLNRLTTGDALAAPDRDRLNGWLRGSTTGNERIRAGLPKDWTVGDKTGTGSTYGTANDIAIAWPPSGAPLIISVYTNRDDAGGEAENRVIAETAAIAARGLGRME